MDSGDFKEQLEKDIAYANSPFHEIRVECDEGSGQVITETILSKKVTDKFTVEFKISSGYSFSGWKAYSKSSDGKLADLSDKNIKFSSYNTESGDGIFKTTVEFVSKADGIIIKPECILLPFVKEIEPKFESAGCDQDSQIKISFNKAVNPESFGDFSCIQLYSDSADLSGCFGTPGFSSDNTALYIPTVKEKLILRPDDASRETLNISVRYDFSGIKDCDGLSLSQSGTHEYRINKNFGNQQKVTVQMSGEDYGSFNAAERECTVGYTFDLQFSLNIANLLGRQLIVKNHHTHRLCFACRIVVCCFFLLLDILFDLFEFAFSDISHLTRPLDFLGEALHGGSSSCIGKEFQLVEIFFGLGLVLLLGNQSHQHSSLSFDFRNHEFFHTYIIFRRKGTKKYVLSIINYEFFCIFAGKTDTM